MCECVPVSDVCGVCFRVWLYVCMCVEFVCVYVCSYVRGTKDGWVYGYVGERVGVWVSE